MGHEGCPPMFTRAVHSAGILLTIRCAMYAARRRHLKHAFSFLKQSPWRHAPFLPKQACQRLCNPTLPRRHGFTGASMVVILLDVSQLRRHRPERQVTSHGGFYRHTRIVLTRIIITLQVTPVHPYSSRFPLPFLR